MGIKNKILFVEDDLDLGFVTKDNLELKGYDIVLQTSGKKALQTFISERFDLCLLDVMLPELDGFTLAKKIREINEHIPIIFLSAKSLKEDRIEGLLSGGDDYITKPFSIEELVLKIEIFLKRNKKNVATDKNVSTALRLGRYLLSTSTMELCYGENRRRLTSREFDLLLYLIKNQNKVLRKKDILLSVWDDDSYFNSRSLDVFISRLRKYLKGDNSLSINNIHGIGFMLSVSSRPKE